MNSARLGLAFAAICALLAVAAIAVAAEPGYSRSLTAGLIAHRERQFGRGVRARLEGWQVFVRETAGPVERPRATDENGLLRSANRYFNRIPSMTDLAHWGVVDYWATPSESLASDGADCEDYAIGKYFTLKELGVPISRLRLVYVKTWRSNEAHMVLAYYPNPSADPLILDNLQGSIESAADRPDLIPVYTFNEEDLLWPQAGGQTIRLSAASNRKWKDLLEKLTLELRY